MFLGAQVLYVLSSDCKRLVTCASVPGLMGDEVLLEKFNDWKNVGEAFYLE